MLLKSIEAMKFLLNQLLGPTLFCLLLVLNLLPQNGWSAPIRVSTDRNPVSLDESFQIFFTTNESPDGDPDFSPLEQDFSVLSQSNASSSSWDNGKTSKTIQWTLNVMAKNTGSLTIPPIKFGADVSDAATILVTQAGANKDIKTDEDLFLEVEATPQSPYVQSQVIYTLRLYTRVDIAQARLKEPELGDAVVEKLGDDSNYNTRVKGVDYSVTERKYAIFPQKSGALTIKPLVLTAEVLGANRLGFNSFFNSQMTQTKRVESKAITLNVKPVPATFTGSHWLSSEQLYLTEQWSGDIKQMKVGEPLTRTLTLQAKGTTVGQLPELNVARTGAQLKSYPDQPVLQEQKKPDGLLAFRQEKIALIPSKAGSYVLPAIAIPWFNTQSQKMEIARLPEKTITAVGGAQPVTVVPDVSDNAAKIESEKKPVAVIPSQPQTRNIWLWVSGFLALGWLITLAYFLTKRPARKPVIENNEADISLKNTIKNLKKACADNDPIAAKVALLEWGRQQFSGSATVNVSSLGAIAGFCEARLRDEILQLNQVLYSQNVGHWSGKKLFQTFTENKARAKLGVAEDKSLEPLYRL